jgi:WD40 repeat protein
MSTPTTLQAVQEAHAAGDWAEVIRRVHALGPQTPPEAAAWLADAWRELPLPEAQVFNGHAGPVLAVAIIPGGRQALSAGYDHTLRLWDLATGETVRTFSGHANRVTTVAITPNGRYALSGSADGTLRLWDLESGLWAGQAVCTCTGHKDWVREVALTPDGRYALSAADDHALYLWDLATGRSIRGLLGHTRPVWSCAVSPTGHTALSGAADGTLRLWDLGLISGRARTLHEFSGYIEDIEAAFDPDVQYNFGVWGVAFAPDGRRALSGGVDCCLRLWDLDPVREVWTCDTRDEVDAVAFSPNGRYALAGQRAGKIRLWDLSGPAEHTAALRTFKGNIGAVLALPLSSDGRTLVTSGGDEFVRVWTLPPGVLG